MDNDPTIPAQPRAVPSGELTYYLVGVEGPLAHRRLEITNVATVLGRRGDASVQIDDPTVSGHHCRIVAVAGQVIVEDLGSRNGTFVDQEQVTQPRVVETECTGCGVCHYVCPSMPNAVTILALPHRPRAPQAG